MIVPVQSEASLDDDAMMAIDDALGQVFRTRFAIKHRKKQQKGCYSRRCNGCGFHDIYCR